MCFFACLVQDFPSQLATKAYPKGLVLGGNCRATQMWPYNPLPKNLRVVNCELSLDMAGYFRKGGSLRFPWKYNHKITCSDLNNWGTKKTNNSVFFFVLFRQKFLDNFLSWMPISRSTWGFLDAKVLGGSLAAMGSHAWVNRYRNNYTLTTWNCRNG